MLCGKGLAKHSAPGAILVHFFGGIKDLGGPATGTP
jgi:mannitol-specific phosphotransferase system IIBC component